MTPLPPHLIVDATPEVERFQAIIRTYSDSIKSGLLGSSSDKGNMIAETFMLRSQANADFRFVKNRVAKQCSDETGKGTGQWVRPAGVSEEVIDSLLRKHEDRQAKWASDYLDSLCS